MGRTVVHNCVVGENYSLLSCLSEGCKELGLVLRCSTEDANGNTPLVLAAKKNDLSCMQLLITAASAEDKEMKTINPVNYEGSRMNFNSHLVASGKSGVAPRSTVASSTSGGHARKVDSMSVSSLSDEDLDFKDAPELASVNVHSKEKRRVNPSHWMECSTNDGRSYYYNTKTEKVQWENPFDGVGKTVKSTEKEKRHSGRLKSANDKFSSRGESGFKYVEETPHEYTDQVHRAMEEALIDKGGSAHDGRWQGDPNVKTDGRNIVVAREQSPSMYTSSHGLYQISDSTLKTPPTEKKKVSNGGRSPASAARSAERKKKQMENFRSPYTLQGLTNSSPNRPPRNLRNTSTTSTSNVPSDSGTENESEKEKHLVVWNRFFENALKVKERRREVDEIVRGDNLPVLNRCPKGSWPRPLNYDEYGSP